ncbi:MAG: hypothetical protein Tsb0020_26210 [Haliangiales bacterium]
MALAPGCGVEGPQPIPTPEESSAQAPDAERPAAGERAADRQRAVPPAGQTQSGVKQPAPAVAPHDIRGGQILKAQTIVAQSGVEPTPSAMFSAARAELPAQLSSFSMSDFQVASETTTQAINGDRLYHTTLQQEIGGVPVEGAYLRLTSRADRKSGAMELASTSYRLYSADKVDSNAVLSQGEAIAAATERLRAPKGAALVRDSLLFASVQGQLSLVWEIAAEGGHYRALVPANGAAAGRVFIEDMRRYESTGTVTSNIAVNGAPGGNAELIPFGMPSLNLSASGGGTATTNNDGTFTIDAEVGETLTAGLSGVASNVVNISGPNLTVTAPADPVVAIDFNPVTTEELAQTTVYLFVDQIREYLLANNVSDAAIGAPLTSNANLTDVCNAFYSPFARTINFFSAGSGCHNTAIDTVIVHEYGHFIDDALGGITNGGLSEGWGDLLACYLLDVAIVGEDFFEDGGIIRSCDNDYQFPPDGNDEVHALGQAWAGFAFQVRQGLIAELGAEEGDAIARAIVLPTLVSNAPNIPEAVREVFINDDDDGDLDNGTVHFDILVAAAEHHNLLNFVFPDEVAPGGVTDLAVLDVTATNVTLQWTATGDDGAEGTATAYDLRFSSAPIDAANFDNATPVVAPTPGAPGTVETAQVAVLPSTTTFFALRVIDDADNASELSNVVEATSEEGVLLFAEDVEDGAADWAATGFWHASDRRAAEGTQAFWYGIEATGNYDNGEANSGTLASPVISLAGAVGPVLTYAEFLDVEAGTTFDIVSVTIENVDDGTQTVTEFNELGFTGGAFVPHVISLTQFEGANIRITFAFDSVDNIANTTEGWFLDDLRIVASDGNAQCAHDLCESGEALDPTCDTCAADVCAVDGFCCDPAGGAWDATCVGLAEDLCGLDCSGGPTCGDGVCEPGEDCETCPEDCGECPPPPVCGDGVCEPGEDCETCPEDCGECGGECVHDLCDEGEPLDPACDQCAADVCAADGFCCEVAWDGICVGLAEDICGLDCSGGPTCGDGVCEPGEDCETCPEDCGECGGECVHDLCDEGEPLDPTCDQCAADVCDVDPFCCDVAWDGICVGLAEDICGLDCGPPGPECGDGVCELGESCLTCATDCGECPACEHDVCETGDALLNGCDFCTPNVCKADPFCCDVAWDGLCVAQVEEHCAITCEPAANPEDLISKR